MRALGPAGILAAALVLAASAAARSHTDGTGARRLAGIFTVTVNGQVSESRHGHQESDSGGCHRVSDFGGGASAMFHSSSPLRVVIERYPDGRLRSDSFAFERIAGTVSRGGSTSEGECPTGLFVIGDCFTFEEPFHTARTTFSLSRRGDIRFGSLEYGGTLFGTLRHGALPGPLPCVFETPVSPPPIGLELARGSISPADLLDPEINVVTAESHLDTKQPYALGGGSAEQLGHVDWTLTFTRVLTAPRSSVPGGRPDDR